MPPTLAHDFVKRYLAEFTQRAVDEEQSVTGISAWSIMDGFRPE